MAGTRRLCGQASRWITSCGGRRARRGSPATGTPTRRGRPAGRRHRPGGGWPRRLSREHRQGHGHGPGSRKRRVSFLPAPPIDGRQALGDGHPHVEPAEQPGRPAKRRRVHAESSAVDVLQHDRHAIVRQVLDPVDLGKPESRRSTSARSNRRDRPRSATSNRPTPGRAARLEDVEQRPVPDDCTTLTTATIRRRAAGTGHRWSARRRHRRRARRGRPGRPGVARRRARSRSVSSNMTAMVNDRLPRTWKRPDDGVEICRGRSGHG